MDNISRLKKRFNEILDNKFEVIKHHDHNRWIYKWKDGALGLAYFDENLIEIRYAIKSIGYYIKENYLGSDWNKFDLDEYAEDYLQAKMKHINRKPV